MRIYKKSVFLRDKRNVFQITIFHFHNKIYFRDFILEHDMLLPPSPMYLEY